MGVGDSGLCASAATGPAHKAAAARNPIQFFARVMMKASLTVAPLRGDTE
jgi:hypothetical protein